MADLIDRAALKAEFLKRAEPDWTNPWWSHSALLRMIDNAPAAPESPTVEELAAVAYELAAFIDDVAPTEHRRQVGQRLRRKYDALFLRQVRALRVPRGGEPRG
jgi:hypothetical protein